MSDTDPSRRARGAAEALPPVRGFPWPAARPLIVILLLVLGEGCRRMFGDGLIDRRTAAVAIVLLLALLIPPVRRWIVGALDRVREPTWTQANWTAAGVAAIAVLLLYAFAHGRPFVPTYHDEHAHLIQMQMLARGRLWMPQHPMADFFDTFLVFVKPVYAAIYFPGTSLLYVPTVWFGLPYWVMPLVVAGAVVGMTYRTLTELIDGVAGVLGGVLLLSLQPFRFVSIKMLSHPLAMLWGLVAVWAWLEWRRQHRRGWALLLGVVLGWAAITRPLDALCFAIPLGAGILWELRHRAIGHWLATLGLIAAGAMPFVGIQLTENHGITGHLLETPYHAYWARNYGGDVLGFAPPNPEWKSRLLQKWAYHENYNLPTLRAHSADRILPDLYTSRLPTLLQADLPSTVLVMLIPVGLLGMTDARRRLVCSILPMFIGAYALFPFFLPHYALPAALPLTLMLILGVRAVAGAWPRQRRPLEAFLTLAVASFALAATPGLRAGISDEAGFWPTMISVHKLLPGSVQAPAVVLFPYRLGDDFHEEPVYNVDVAWPDDAPIIRAQDLGPARDMEIAAYYARTQPERNFYRFDRRTGSVQFLGKPRAVLAALEAKLAAGPASTPGPSP